jgi:hypothetical protein
MIDIPYTNYTLAIRDLGESGQLYIFEIRLYVTATISCSWLSRPAYNYRGIRWPVAPASTRLYTTYFLAVPLLEHYLIGSVYNDVPLAFPRGYHIASIQLRLRLFIYLYCLRLASTNRAVRSNK